MPYHVKYLSNVDDYLNAVSVQEQRKILRQLKYLQEYGLKKEVLNLKKLSGYEFWEIRIIGKRNTRIFCYQLKNTIYILHIFRKNTQKTKKTDLKSGEERMKALLTSYI